METYLYLAYNNHILAINVYFNMLRINSHINQYQDMWPLYKETIRVIVDDYLPKKKGYVFNAQFEHNFLKQETKGINFDPLTVEVSPEDILNNLVASIKNIRKGIAVDTNSVRIVAIANEMKRTSFMADMEYKYCLALRF